MKTKLLILSLLLISFEGISQVVANQVDDFEDGTVQGWFEGSSNPPVNIATGGPAGVDDNYMQNDSSGSSSEGGKMINRNISQWRGNYTSEAIIGIRFDVRVLTADLTLRIAMKGAGGVICSSTGVPVAAGSGWTSVTIPIAAADMVTVTANNAPDGFDIAATLASVSEFRILSNSVPSYIGEEINSRMELDNITAVTTLGINEQSQSNEFKIIQNPSRSKLMLSLPNSEVKLDVFDVLGKKILSKQLSGLTSSIDVSKWNNGIYLVRVTSSEGTQTKRFVKQ